MEVELTAEQQQALKYITFIGDPTNVLKCLAHQNQQCKHYCKNCHAPICPKCIQKHQNQSGSGKRDAHSDLSGHVIVDIEELAKRSLDQYVQAYLEIEYFKENRKDYFERRTSLFTRECRNFMLKLHKFVSHFFVQAQQQIIGSVDQQFTKWTAQKAELTQLRDSENFNELFLRQKEIKKARKEMRSYKKELDSRVENNIFDDIKLEVCRRVEKAMFELSQTLNFAVEEENLGAFDDLLACAKIEEIQYYLG